MRSLHASPIATSLGGALAAALAAGLTLAACDSAPAAPTASASAKPTVAAPPASSPAAQASPPPTATTAAAASGSAKPLGPNAVDLAAMNLALEPPPGVVGSAQPAGGDQIVRFHGHEVSLTISVAHGDMAHEKKRIEGEKGFTKWALDKDDMAIAEIEVDHAKEYLGFTVKKIGDASYECSTLTMKRPTSPNEAAVKEALALCGSLRGK